MAQRRKKPKGSLKDTVRGWFAMPPPGFYSRSALHLDCRGRLEVENCKAVLTYTETEIELDLGSMVADIRGDELALRSLAGKNLFIQGQIFKIEFKAGEKSK